MSANRSKITAHFADILRFSDTNLIALILFLLPLVYFNLYYEQIKVLTFVIGISLILLLQLTRRLSFPTNIIQSLSLMYLFSIFISAIFGLNFPNSLTGQNPFFQGFLLQLLLVIFSFQVAIAGANKLQYFKTLNLSAVLVSLFSIFNQLAARFFSYSLPFYDGREVGTFGQPNHLGGFLLLVWPLSYSLAKKQKSIYRYLSLILITVGVLVSQSKTAIIILIFLIIYKLISNLKYKYLLIAFSGLFLLICLIYATISESGIIWEEVSMPLNPATQFQNPKYSAEKRVYLWLLAPEIFKDHPLTGVGSANISISVQSFDFLPIFRDPNLYYLVQLRTLRIDSFHNLWLDILVSSGLFGVSIYLFIIIFALKYADPESRKFLILYLLWSFFQPQSIVHLTLFWLIIGLIEHDLDVHKKITYDDIDAQT